MSASGAPSGFPPARRADPEARLGELLERAEQLRLRGLAFDDLRELGRLYRASAARLARLRDRADDPEAIRHLNALCVRAYGLLYVAPGRRSGGRAWLFERLPAALARTWHAQCVAWALLAAGLLLGYALGTRDPGAIYALVPASLGYEDGGLTALVETEEARRSFLEREENPAHEKAVFGSYLFTHNTQVGLLSFAAGILAAVPTCLLQLYNGLVLGAFGAIFLREPVPVEFLAWILPHGVPELTAITLCASAGLLLGLAVAAPGRRGRAAALRDSLDPALLLFGASIPLFALAAVVESFVRESAMGTAPRLAIAATFFALLLGGLALVRRAARRRQVDTRWLGDLIAPARSEAPGTGSRAAR
jgi:uncharacterized membrane protein SpoIIM required for sporulation